MQDTEATRREEERESEKKRKKEWEDEPRKRVGEGVRYRDWAAGREVR